jgi:hypothetical protein
MHESDNFISTNNHKGFRWGPFITRLPCLHVRVELSELIQGLFLGTTTGLACIPLFTHYFGLTFECALTFLFIQSFLIASATVVFGEPMAPGWITPAFPIILAMMPYRGQIVSTQEIANLQFMTAITIDFAILTFLLGITRMGPFVVRRIPPLLKAGILFISAGAAFRAIVEQVVLQGQVWTIGTGLILALLLLLAAFKPEWILNQRILSIIVRMGLIPGLIGAAIIGMYTNELSFQLSWDSFFMTPCFLEVQSKVNPFLIGFPDWWVFLMGLPLAMTGYIFLCGDMVMGEEIIRNAQLQRPDEIITPDPYRTHLSVAIRNGLMAFLCPFFSTQGCLWTGAHVLIVERWKRGCHEMPSLFGGLSSWYLFGFQILFFVNPLTCLLKPLLQTALAMTLCLTGVVCCRVGAGLVKSKAGWLILIIVGYLWYLYSYSTGLLIGSCVGFFLRGKNEC